MAECPGKPVTPCWQTGALKDCSVHGTQGACDGDVCCGPWSGSCTGTSSHNCGSYPSCSGAPCCQGNHYTGCTGTVSSCPGSPPCGDCCDQEEATCGGAPNSRACTTLYHDGPSCDGDACCWWNSDTSSCVKRSCGSGGLHPVSPPHCAECGCGVETYTCSKKNCADIAEGNCTGCGCSKTGDCPRVACASVPYAQCASCTGCSQSGSCPSRACAGMASAACVQCTGCSCCWKIETTCEITSNATAYSLWIAANGKVTHTGGTITLEDYKRTPAVGGNSYYYRTAPAVRRVSGHGSRCCG